MSKRRMWTEEEEDVLRQYYPTRGGQRCANLLQDLGYPRTIRQVYWKVERMGIRRNKQSIPYQRKAIVYKLPDCPKCEILKKWLIKFNIRFEERWFDAIIQAEFIMENEFGDPPILLLRGDWIASDSLFDEYTFNKLEAHKFINDTRGVSFPSAYTTHKYCKKCGEWIWRPLAGERCDVCGSLYSDKVAPWRKRR